MLLARVDRFSHGGANSMRDMLCFPYDVLSEGTLQWLSLFEAAFAVTAKMLLLPPPILQGCYVYCLVLSKHPYLLSNVQKEV